MELFWRTCEHTNLQFKAEVEQFAAFIRDRVKSGNVEDPYISEVLEFELAIDDLRFKPRRRILLALQRAPAEMQPTGVSMNPLVRLLRFRHNPVVLLQMLVEQKQPPSKLPEGEFFLLLDGRANDLALSMMESRTGRQLEEVARGGYGLSPSTDFVVLIKEGLLVPVPRDDEAGPACVEPSQQI
jgi:hypothetical protein